MTTQTRSTLQAVADTLWWFFGVPFRTETYKHLVYLALAFPLGTIYFVGVAVGLSTGTGLLVTLVGVPILLVTLYLTTVIAGIEASLARLLLDVDVPTPPLLADAAAETETDDPDATTAQGLIDWIRRLLTAPTTWTGLVLVGLKFAFGIVSFTAFVVLGVFSGALLSAPLLYDQPSVTIGVVEPSGGPGGVVGVSKTSAAHVLWAVDSLPEALAATAVGVLAALVALHLLNGLARAGGLLTAALLDVGRPTDDGERAA